MRETRTSLGPASAETRWARCTATAADVVAAHFDLAGMEARSNLDPQTTSARTDRLRAAHPAGRPVEGGQDAISGRLHLAASEPAQLLSDHVVVTVEEVVPVAVAAAARLARSIPRCR